MPAKGGFLCAQCGPGCLNYAITERHSWRSDVEAAADPSAQSVPKATGFFKKSVFLKMYSHVIT